MSEAKSNAERICGEHGTRDWYPWRCDKKAKFIVFHLENGKRMRCYRCGLHVKHYKKIQPLFPENHIEIFEMSKDTTP